MGVDEKVIREKSIKSYKDIVMKINPSHDRELIEKGLIFMYGAHKGQKRLSGKPYIEHPVNVGELLAADFSTIYVAGGYLHDVVEDTDVTIEEIEEKFGTEIANLVDDMTIRPLGENRKDHINRIIKEKKAVPIKFADFIHNIRTSDAIKKEYFKRYLLERANYILTQTKIEFGYCKLYQYLQNEVITLEKAIKKSMSLS